MDFYDVIIIIFCSHHFLTEFLEVGGMLTLLEIISLQTSKERDKAESLRLLTSIASKGRQFKELLCESFGKECKGSNCYLGRLVFEVATL